MLCFCRGGPEAVFNQMTADKFWTEEKVKILEKGHLDFPQNILCTDRARRYRVS